MRIPNPMIFLNMIGKHHMSTSSQKICNDCKYFIPDKRECKLLNTTDLVTGHVTYEYASIARISSKDKDRCGEDGTKYETNQVKIFTVPYYFLKSNWGVLIYGGMVGLYVYITVFIPK